MAEDMTFLPKAEILTLEELDRLCSAFVRLGVRKLRLTGGEPLVRKNIMSLVRGLSRHLASGALDELTLTTNGSQLARHAAELAACGVRRINVSIDTLDPAKFARITRWGRLDQVEAGLAAAQAAGLAIKINAVALKGVNEDEFDDLVRWCGDRGFDLTFIEVMPMGEIGGMTDQLAAVGGQGQLVQGAGSQMARKGAHQAHHVLAHQRLAAGQPELAHPHPHEGAAQPVQLLQGQDLRLGQEGHVFRHAIDAAEVAAVRHRDPKVGDGPPEGVDDGRLACHVREI